MLLGLRSFFPQLFRNSHDIQIASKFNPIPTTFHCHAACDGTPIKHDSLSRDERQQVCTIFHSCNSAKHRMLDLDNPCFGLDGR